MAKLHEKKMRIALVAIHFAKGRIASPEPHLVNLFNSIFRIDQINEYILFARKDNINCFNISYNNTKVILFPTLCRYMIFRIFCEQIIIPILSLFLRVDLIHFNANVGPIISPCKTVGTIHWTPDPLTMASFSWYKKIYFKVLFKFSVGKADKLIAVSNSCKEEAIKSLKIDPRKIAVIYHGIGDIFLSGHKISKSQASVTLPSFPQKYLLTITSLEPYKALPITLTAFLHAKRKFNIVESLVLVGNINNELLNNIEKKIDCNFAWDLEVFNLGYIPYEYLPAIYKNASGLIYHSLRETFGIPLIEAMSMGVPSVISNIPALKEIAGNASLIVDPNDINQLSKAINSICSNADVVHNLRNRGYERIVFFTWDKAANATIKLYHDTV